VLNLDGELLTRTEDIVWQWKEHFEDLFNLESEDLGKDSSITLAEVIGVVKKLVGSTSF